MALTQGGALLCPLGKGHEPAELVQCLAVKAKKRWSYPGRAVKAIAGVPHV